MYRIIYNYVIVTIAKLDLDILAETQSLILVMSDSLMNPLLNIDNCFYLFILFLFSKFQYALSSA